MVLMVVSEHDQFFALSVLALSSRFDGRTPLILTVRSACLSVLALSSRFDGHPLAHQEMTTTRSFSTRSVESF